MPATLSYFFLVRKIRRALLAMVVHDDMVVLDDMIVHDATIVHRCARLRGRGLPLHILAHYYLLSEKVHVGCYCKRATLPAGTALLGLKERHHMRHHKVHAYIVVDRKAPIRWHVIATHIAHVMD